MLSDNPSNQSPESQVLRCALFFADSLLIDLHCDPAIGMTKEFLCCLDIHTLLPKGRSKPVTEGVETDLLRNPDPLQRRSNVALQNRVRRDCLCSILYDGRDRKSSSDR